LETTAKNKFRTSVEVSGETADVISMQGVKATANYDLETKVLGLSANNNNTNFEGLVRESKENV
jgi:hypothetical protein